MKKYSIFIFLFGVAIPFASSAFSLSSITGNNFFGGEVQKVLPCTCPADLASILTIKDGASGKTIKIKFAGNYSKLNKYYNPIFAKYVVGGSMSGDTACRQVSYTGCTTGSSGDSDKVVDTWRGIGTSLK